MSDKIMTSAAWTASDEIRYLRSAVERHGKAIKGEAVIDAKKILSLFIKTCRIRRWPPTFNIDAAEAEAQLLLESLP